jgi:pentatricopeptide repeat protein
LSLGLEPNNGTIEEMLKCLACAGRLDRLDAMVHETLRRRFRCTPHAMAMIVKAYCQVGNIEKALETKKQLAELGTHINIVTFNTLAQYYSKTNDLASANQLLLEMRSANIPPDERTFTSILSMFVRHNDPRGARKIFELMRATGVRPNIYSFNVMLRVHCNAGDIEGAKRILCHEMPEGHVIPDLISYKAIIRAAAASNDVASVKDMYSRMIVSGIKPTKELFHMMIRFLIEANERESAWFLLNDEMPKFNIRPDAHMKRLFQRTLGDSANKAAPTPPTPTTKTTEPTTKIPPTNAAIE